MRLLTILSFLLLTSCQNQAQPDVYEVVPIDQPTNIEVEGHIASREQLLKPIMDAIAIQVEERLPFDEPRTEIGQQDGKLRARWYTAYRRKKLHYEFNGDRYYTFTKGMKPFVPQVCADFLVDTLDRAAGTWYRSSRRHPGRVVGKFDVRKMIHDDGFYPRRVWQLVEFFKKHPDDFEFVFEGKGAEVGDIPNLKRFFNEHDAQIGDIVFIHGKVPWDPIDQHTHSFFITGVDEKGLIDKVTGNPVFPVERSLRIEGRRSPKRRVTHIIRMTDHFLMKLQ